MMSTYEIVVAIFSSNSTPTATTTSEVTTLQPKKVYVTNVDAEANAANESEN